MIEHAKIKFKDIHNLIIKDRISFLIPLQILTSDAYVKEMDWEKKKTCLFMPFLFMAAIRSSYYKI